MSSYAYGYYDTMRSRDKKKHVLHDDDLMITLYPLPVIELR